MIVILFLLTLICVLLLVSIWASLVTYSFFWYENAWRERFAQNLGKLKWMVLAGVLSSVASMSVLIVSYPLGLIRRLWEPHEIDLDGPLIILAHGVYHNASAWILLKRRLRKAGFKNIFILSYGSFFTSFERTLERFEDFVAMARSMVPNQPVYLIGHSLGGLLARVYAEKSHGAAVPAAVITLGSPHQGSKIAAFGIGKLASSLIYRGHLFAEIESGPARLPCDGIAVCSPVDNMVLPAEALRVPYPGWVYLETAPLSHTAMLYSRSTAKLLVEVLQNEIVPRYSSRRGGEDERRRW